MRCLWVTWIDPFPEYDGQRIYSGRMIEATANAGADIDVLCFERNRAPCRIGPRHSNPSINWWLVPRQVRPAWRSTFSTLPHIAHRSGTSSMKAGLCALLQERRWDGIVLDGLYTGWALPLLDAADRGGAGRPRRIYISHNHEETTRGLIADNYAGNVLVRAALRHDAHKAARLERQMVDRADIVTAVTMEDARHFSSSSPQKPILVLSPGYAGRRVEQRDIGRETPRRALLVGSFEWFAKQMNLKEFLAIADPIFAAAGIEMQIVGNGEAAFFESLRRDLKATEIVGPVKDINPYLEQARLAIIPERTGGGFKLKMLDYIFNRVPIAALDQAIAGLPLMPDESVLAFPHQEELAAGVVGVMDDLDRLNRLQDRAFSICANAFDWAGRGRRLMAALSSGPDRAGSRPLGALS